MHPLIVQYIAETQERNPRARATIICEDLAIIDHNVGNYTLEVVETDENQETIIRNHVAFTTVKTLSALVQMHYTLKN